MIRIGKASKIIGVTPQTLRKYSKEKRIPFYVNGAGQYLYKEEDLYKFIGIEQAQEERIVFYIRSSSGQKASLDTQKETLTQEYGTPLKIYQDKSSGLNDNRPGLNSLIKNAQNKEFTTICITNKDRLTRFGYKYLEQLFAQNNIKIKTLNTNDKITLEQELMQDFMSLIASFSGKFYRLRGYQQQRKLLKTAETEINKKEKE